MSIVITDDEARENIAANVMRLMERRGMSQVALATASGENEMYISRICRGKILPNAAALARIAEALQTTSEALMDPVPAGV